MFKYTYSTAMFLIMLVANGLFFANYGLRHEIEFWACYGFVMFAFLTMWFATLRQEDSSMMYLFGITRASIGLVYLILALIAGVGLYMIDAEGLLLYAPQAAIALFFIILMLFVSEIDDRHAEIEAEVVEKTDFVREALDKMDEAKLMCNDDSTSRSIDMLIDMLVSAQSTPLKTEIGFESVFMSLTNSLKRNIKAGSYGECKAIIEKMEKSLIGREKEISRIRH